MSGLCSVCMLKSPNELTPLFTKNENDWQSTGLSRILETVLKKEIQKGHELLLSICTKCIYKISKAFHENDLFQTMNISDFWADKLSTLAPVIEEENSQEKMSPENELKLKQFKRAYSVLLDEEEANRRKKLKTTDELKIIKFEVQENKDYINCLPLESIAQIFMYLSPAERLEMEQVCQRWTDAAEIAWGDIKAFDSNYFRDKFCKPASDELVEQFLSRCGRFLKKLHPGYSHSSKILPIANSYCQNLEEISVNVREKMDENDFNDAFSTMEVLREISVDIGHPEGLPLDFAHILSSVTENIEEIDLRHSDDVYYALVHDNFINALNRFRVLKSLFLDGLNLNEYVMAGISNVKTLVKLQVDNCRFESNALLISDLPNLEKLEYHYNENDSPSLISIANNCENLKKLTIYTDHLSVAAINELKKLKQLEYFTLEYSDDVDNNVIGVLVESCQNLKHLDLNDGIIGNLTDFGFQNVAYFRNLEHLSVSDSQKVGDKFFSSIAMKCKKLKHLNLSGCTGISNSGLRKLGNLINLEYLDIQGIDHIDDSVIFTIINNCIKLKTLNLYNLHNISKSALETLSQLKDLECLDVDKMKKVDDDVVLKIAGNCKKLRRLEMDTCEDISDVVVKELIDNCPSLEYLNVRSSRITEDTIRFAVKKTKIRSNNVVLTMVINPSLKTYCKAYTGESRFLSFSYYY